MAKKRSFMTKANAQVMRAAKSAATVAAYIVVRQLAGPRAVPGRLLSPWSAALPVPGLIRCRASSSCS